MGEHDDLQPTETQLTGVWHWDGQAMHGDAACRRIKHLVATRLERLGSDESGWETLYRDPRDGRLWEHTYPESYMHGGGPPALRVISPADAAAKYRVGTI